MKQVNKITCKKLVLIKFHELIFMVVTNLKIHKHKNLVLINPHVALSIVVIICISNSIFEICK